MHVTNRAEFDLYLKTACATHFINIRGIDDCALTCTPPYDTDLYEIKNMYFLEAVNLDDVNNELLRIENELQKYKRIVGIKIYLGYQQYYANDPKVFAVAEFCRTQGLTLAFHCGETFVNNTDNTANDKYANAKHIKDLLVAFPDVNFVASHLNWPHFDDLFGLIEKYDNIYTCISGCIDGETTEARNIQCDELVELLKNYLSKYPKLKDRLMYGTDFFAGGGVKFTDVSIYAKVAKELNIADANILNAYRIHI